jgi:hypothetical protein
MKFNVAPLPDVDPVVGIADDAAEAGRLDSLVQRAVHGAGAIEERVARWLAQHAPEASPLHADYLRRDLLHRLVAAPVRYTLLAQLEKSAEATPIENTLVEWKEADTPSVPVADLVLIAKHPSTSGLRFTPAHFIVPGRSETSRADASFYAASQTAAVRGVDPPKRVFPERVRSRATFIGGDPGAGVGLS